MKRRSPCSTWTATGGGDLVTAASDGVLGTYRGRADGTFSSRVEGIDGFLTRRACASAGCF